MTTIEVFASMASELCLPPPADRDFQLGTIINAANLLRTTVDRVCGINLQASTPTPTPTPTPTHVLVHAVQAARNAQESDCFEIVKEWDVATEGIEHDWEIFRDDAFSGIKNARLIDWKNVKSTLDHPTTPTFTLVRASLRQPVLAKIQGYLESADRSEEVELLVTTRDLGEYAPVAIGADLEAVLEQSIAALDAAPLKPLVVPARCINVWHDGALLQVCRSERQVRFEPTRDVHLMEQQFRRWRVPGVSYAVSACIVASKVLAGRKLEADLAAIAASLRKGFKWIKDKPTEPDWVPDLKDPKERKGAWETTEVSARGAIVMDPDISRRHVMNKGASFSVS